jgi:hypothetical protein
MQYRTIVADPPWPQKGGGSLKGREGFLDAGGRSLPLPYRTMTVGYWACSIKGIQDYGRKVRERKEERRSSWQARVDRDDEYSDSITELIEQRDKEGSER